MIHFVLATIQFIAFPCPNRFPIPLAALGTIQQLATQRLFGFFGADLCSFGAGFAGLFGGLGGSDFGGSAILAGFAGGCFTSGFGSTGLGGSLIPARERNSFKS